MVCLMELCLDEIIGWESTYGPLAVHIFEMVVVSCMSMLHGETLVKRIQGW